MALQIDINHKIDEFWEVSLTGSLDADTATQLEKELAQIFVELEAEGERRLEGLGQGHVLLGLVPDLHVPARPRWSASGWCRLRILEWLSPLTRHGYVGCRSQKCGMQVADMLGGAFGRRVTDMWGCRLRILDAEVAGGGVRDLWRVVWF